jgi:hypothetical protein
MSWTTAYKAALRQLSTPSLYGEVLKLQNSVTHLRRSNDELKVHAETEQEDISWIETVIAENEEVIAKQTEQVQLAKAEIMERDAWSEHGQEDSMNGDGASEALELGDLRDHQGEENGDHMDIDGDDDGVHL